MSVVIAGLSPAIFVPATLYLPGGDGVPFHEHAYQVGFRRVEGDEYKALQDKFVKGEMGVSDFCDSVVVGWRGMLDGAGQEVPYSHAERRETETVYRGLEQSMAVAFFDLYEAHQRQAAEKNSVARSATTSASTAPTVTSSTTS